MSRDLHPSLLDHYISTHFLASVASWGLVFIAWSLLLVGTACKTLESRVAFAGAALSCSLVARPVRRIAIDTDRTQSDVADISTQSFQNWLFDRMKPDSTQVQLAPAATGDELDLFEFDSILEESTGVAVLGNSGSGKTSVTKHLCSLMGDTQILVLDAHDDGQTWGDLPVISEYEDIVRQLHFLLAELDERRKKRKRREALEPLVVICEEFPAVRDYCSQINDDVADRFILRFGSECRKFDILAIFCSHSGNTKALGLEGKGDFLENYTLIRLCRVAIKYSKNMSDRSILPFLKKQGFACLVGDEPSIHPTHGHYLRFKKKLPPRYLYQLRSLPLTIELAVPVTYQATQSRQVPPGSVHGSEPVQNHEQVPPGSVDRTYLERLWNLEFDVPPHTPEPMNRPPDSPTSDQGDDGSGGGSEFPEIDDISDNQMRTLILQFRQIGVNSQDDFISSMWGISKGGSKRYQRAKERYQEVCKKFGL